MERAESGPWRITGWLTDELCPEDISIFRRLYRHQEHSIFVYFSLIYSVPRRNLCVP